MVSWACQRMASKGRRNPVCKSHHRDFVTIRGLFTLFYYHCLILLTRQCSAVYRWCNSAVKKRRKKGGEKHKNMLFKPPSCTPGASVQKGKKNKKKNGDALHLPCVTPHPLPAQHDSFISAEEEAVCELTVARHLSTQLNRSFCTSNQDLTNGQMSLCCQVSDMHT